MAQLNITSIKVQRKPLLKWRWREKCTDYILVTDNRLWNHYLLGFMQPELSRCLLCRIFCSLLSCKFVSLLWQTAIYPESRPLCLQSFRASMLPWRWWEDTLIAMIDWYILRQLRESEKNEAESRLLVIGLSRNHKRYFFTAISAVTG